MAINCFSSDDSLSLFSFISFSTPRGKRKLATVGRFVLNSHSFARFSKAFGGGFQQRPVRDMS